MPSKRLSPRLDVAPRRPTLWSNPCRRIFSVDPFAVPCRSHLSLVASGRALAQLVPGRCDALPELGEILHPLVGGHHAADMLQLLRRPGLRAEHAPAALLAPAAPGALRSINPPAPTTASVPGAPARRAASMCRRSSRLALPPLRTRWPTMARAEHSDSSSPSLRLRETHAAQRRHTLYNLRRSFRPARPARWPRLRAVCVAPDPRPVTWQRTCRPRRSL